MKPLYWKFLLIVGAMIVGASLVVPKALRKNAIHDTNNVAQTLFVSGQSQNVSLGAVFGQSEDVIATVGTGKYLTLIYATNFSRFSFAIVTRFITNFNMPTHSLNAGTRPTKSRVID